MVSWMIPAPHVRQISGEENGRPTLNVLVKLTYDIDRSGKLVPSTNPRPLVSDLEVSPDHPELVVRDTDLYPHKPLTDIIVHGLAYPPTRMSRFEVLVAVGQYIKKISVLGPRKVYMGPGGTVKISPPEFIEAPVPLTFDQAYGGYDAHAAAKLGDPREKLAPYIDDPGITASLYSYPRNPAGKGYLVDASAQAVEELQLPALEDPEDPITARNLVIGAWDRWPHAPLPAALGWADPGAFPRVAYFGVFPAFSAELDALVWKEVRRGFAAPTILERKPPTEKFDLRASNGAPLGLAVPYLKGDESVVLSGLRPGEPLRFTLPSTVPKLAIDGRDGLLKDVQPVLQTVEIDAQQRWVSLVWRGGALARRPYASEELATMPFRVIA